MLSSFLERFVRTFIPQPFRPLAVQTGWCRRRGKIDPFEFFTSLTFGQMSAGRQTLTAPVQGLAEVVTRQAVDQRFTPAAVAYFQAAFAHVLAQTLDGSPTPPQAEALRAHFPRLYLLDTTGFDCPATLQALFPSCGGAGSAANVKVLLRSELMAGRREPLAVLAGQRSDQGPALRAAHRLEPGDLQLQDKGFYGAKAWPAAQARGAYLLRPLPHSLTLWFSANPPAGERSLDLAAALKATTENRREWPQLLLGTQGHRTGALRLVAFRLSPESAGRHRQGLREARRTQGRTPSAQTLELAGGQLLLTNAPAEKLPTAMLSYRDRLRLQVELIFRQIKTVLRLDQTGAHKPCRGPEEEQHGAITAQRAWKRSSASCRRGAIPWRAPSWAERTRSCRNYARSGHTSCPMRAKENKNPGVAPGKISGRSGWTRGPPPSNQFSQPANSKRPRRPTASA